MGMLINCGNPFTIYVNSMFLHLLPVQLSVIAQEKLGKNKSEIVRDFSRLFWPLCIPASLYEFKDPLAKFCKRGNQNFDGKFVESLDQFRECFI